MDLKSFRKAYKLSQSDLAELFGCTQAHVSSLELGTRSITKSQLEALVGRFGLDNILPFASESEKPILTLGAVRNEISGNSAPVQQGNDNTISTDAQLVKVMLQQGEQINTLLEHQSRLISIIESYAKS